MTETPTTVLLCSCEDTMRLHPSAVRAAVPGAEVRTVRHACGADLEAFRATGGDGATVVACTAMSSLFEAVAASDGRPGDLRFVNVRETAGWSAEGDRAGPKTAALVAAALQETAAVPTVTFESEGRALVVGAGQGAADAARALQDRLEVTLLVPDVGAILPSRRDRFALVEGRARAVRGHLGAFQVTVDGHAPAAPSSRQAIRTGARQDGVVVPADILVDLTGGPAFVTAADLRPGYVRADPRDRAAVAEALLAATDLVGTFDKPRFIDFSESLCAHSRSRKSGCRRCLDVCPTGAISPAADHVVIDPFVCAGCGSCASVCPTGAASYALPAADGLMRRLRALMLGYRAAGGESPVVLFHDDGHGADLIEALARFGDGLPARVLPVAVNEITRVGPEQIAALFAYGASAVRFLGRARPRHDLGALAGAMTLMEPVLSALGYGDGLVGLIETDDPDALFAALATVGGTAGALRPATFLPTGPKRAVFDLALAQLHAVAPTPVDAVALPAGAPFGRVVVDTDGCTLCLACTSACPTAALGDNPDRPMLTFDESLCVQCGLCASTCPERVITLEPRLAFVRPGAQRQVIKEEEPFCCISCGKPFGTRSTIERVAAKLAGAHWMFSGDGGRADLVRMCDTCRVTAVTRRALDPYAGPDRPKPRTSDDHVRARASMGQSEDSA
ncbi:4Fe-4S binding protein [Chthonobacter rhizosphaerae]|uniref:4Fe-4S binding protein n=1 Tax=Chthonobacter rhizosphaerae TaxID=2735553 RepID=UPI0015EEE6EA|nr:4Fe-4S binding protein [Chthonobacter rhizosphaerae]